MRLAAPAPRRSAPPLAVQGGQLLPAPHLPLVAARLRNYVPVLPRRNRPQPAPLRRLPPLRSRALPPRGRQDCRATDQEHRAAQRQEQLRPGPDLRSLLRPVPAALSGALPGSAHASLRQGRRHLFWVRQPYLERPPRLLLSPGLRDLPGTQRLVQLGSHAYPGVDSGAADRDSG